MTFPERLQLLRRMDDLIRRKATGTPEEFARRLGISVATLSRRIDDLEANGAVIKYDKTGRTYYYQTECLVEL